MHRVWKAACVATGVEISLYEGTKHSRATDLLRQGVTERVLQALLGHRDARSTRRYARLADEALVDAIRPRCGSPAKPAEKAAEESGGRGGGGGNRTRRRAAQVPGRQGLRGLTACRQVVAKMCVGSAEDLLAPL